MLRASNSSLLYASILVLYAVLGGLVSLSQFDYVNADFVAYATIARRTIETPGSAVTAYWSSLFAWMMVPLFYFQIDDLIAGRIVLLASGAVYLSAIYRLTVIHSYGDRRTHRLIQIGTMACSIVQAVIWANYLLAPDLIANAILYIYFCAVSQEHPRDHQPGRGIVAGVVAGFAYLTKAYMLPFCCVHFVITSLMRRIFNTAPASLANQLKSGLLTLGLFGLGLGLVAGPWIACLSQKCGRLTISTAGSSNHANMSPQHFRKDPLWNPGLNANYIFEPGLTPDWSAFQDTNHFQHQLLVVWYNFLNCVGLIPLWLTVFVGCSAALLYQRIHVSREERDFLYWIAMTVSVYCGGYTLVNLEARYIIPTVVPLLCFGSLIMLRSILNDLMLSRSNDRKCLQSPNQMNQREIAVHEDSHSQLARIRVKAGDHSTYLDLFPELPARAGKRKMAVAASNQDRHPIRLLHGGVLHPVSPTSDAVLGESIEEMIPALSSDRQVTSQSLMGGSQSKGDFSRHALRLFWSRPVLFVAVLIALLSAVDLHNLYRVTSLHPQAASMKQFRLIAARLNQLGIEDAPTACSNLHFGLFVAYASNRLTNYWGAPLSRSGNDITAELAAKEIKVFLRVLREPELVDRPSNNAPFSDESAWVKTATIRDKDLLPNGLEVYVRR